MVKFFWDGRFECVEIISGGVENFRGGGAIGIIFEKVLFFLTGCS